MKHLRIGFARTDITPPNPAPNYRGKILQLPPDGEPRLECIASVISVGQETVSVVSLDALCISRELVLRIRERASLLNGINAPTNLVIAATHTHCAPHLAPAFTEGVAPDPMYSDIVSERVVRTLEEAISNMCEAELFAGKAKCPGFEFNRRFMRKDGRVVTTLASESVTGLESCGGIDDEIPFWFFKSASGDPLGAIFSYPCHNNAARSPFMSPDIAGYCRQAMAEKLGGGFTGLMLAGACGDVTWVDPVERPSGGSELAERIGRRVADSVLNATENAEAIEVDTLRYLSRIMVIADRLPSESSYCDDGCRGSSQEEMEVQKKRYAPEREAVESRGATSAAVEVSALVLRDTALVTNPAELFVGLGLKIRSCSPFPVTMVVELANGYVGYVPSERDFELGGYETHRTVYTSRLVKRAGRQIVESSLALLNQNGTATHAE